jgi:hypothetical protein
MLSRATAFTFYKALQELPLSLLGTSKNPILRYAATDKYWIRNTEFRLKKSFLEIPFCMGIFS